MARTIKTKNIKYKCGCSHRSYIIPPNYLIAMFGEKEAYKFAYEEIQAKAKTQLCEKCQ